LHESKIGHLKNIGFYQKKITMQKLLAKSGFQISVLVTDIDNVYRLVDPVRHFKIDRLIFN